MIEYIGNLLKAMRPAFSRLAAFKWFVLVFIGFIVRNDSFGVSSIIRALWLKPSYYACLVHFFHSSAWSGNRLLECWQQWLVKEKFVYHAGERIVMVGDHTKTPKDGRKMPEVSTMHQNSETAGKPTFFRGHNWAFIGLLVNSNKKFFTTPLWAEIHKNSLQYSQATRIVDVAGSIAQKMGRKAYLVLDAFFAVGTVFKMSAQFDGFLHILTRAKKNVVAYLPPLPEKIPRRGRPRLYGEKLHLMDLFDLWDNKFKTKNAVIYQQQEKVRYLTIDLIWRPIKKKIRFFLFETSRGRIILMSSDLSLEPLIAIKLYSRRVTIETMFDALKNILGGMKYHFWSKYLKPVSRRPVKNNKTIPFSSQPEKTKNTLNAIEKYTHILLISLGTLQLLACHFDKQICSKARCWLRTSCSDVPSVFVTKNAVSNIIRKNLISIGKDWITQLILQKQNSVNNSGYSRKIA